MTAALADVGALVRAATRRLFGGRRTRRDQLRDEYLSVSADVVGWSTVYATAIALGDDDAAHSAKSQLEGSTDRLQVLRFTVPDDLLDSLRAEGSLLVQGASRQAQRRAAQLWGSADFLA